MRIPDRPVSCPTAGKSPDAAGTRKTEELAPRAVSQFASRAAVSAAYPQATVPRLRGLGRDPVVRACPRLPCAVRAVRRRRAHRDVLEEGNYVRVFKLGAKAFIPVVMATSVLIGSAPSAPVAAASLVPGSEAAQIIRIAKAQVGDRVSLRRDGPVGVRLLRARPLLLQVRGRLRRRRVRPLPLGPLALLPLPEPRSREPRPAASPATSWSGAAALTSGSTSATATRSARSPAASGSTGSTPSRRRSPRSSTPG